MKRDTPLTEVATLIPKESAALLMDFPYPTQCAVLDSVRGMMTDWEENGICLDPIALEGVLRSFILRLAATLLTVEILKLRLLEG